MLCDLAQVVFGQVAIAHEVLNQRLRRPAKYPIDELLDHLAQDSLPWTRGTVDEGAVLPTDLQMPFPLQNPHRRHHGGVGNLPARSERFVHVPDGGRAKIPDDLHDLELLPGQDWLRAAHVY